MKMPLSYFGGKFNLAKEIIPYFPVHHTYIEPFCGVCHVFMQKQSSSIEILNDIYSLIINFFRCIQDKEKREKILEWLELCIHHQDFHKELQIEIEKENIEDWKLASYFFYLNRFSRNGLLKGSFGYGKRNIDQNKHTIRFFNSIQKFKEDDLIKRLQQATFFNEDFEKLIDRFDSKESFFYCDPPYLHETRVDKNAYTYEMSNEDHQRLLSKLLNMKGMAIISGYKNEMYKQLEENDWIRKDFENTIYSGQKETKEIRIESIWINPSAQANQKQKEFFYEKDW